MVHEQLGLAGGVIADEPIDMLLSLAMRKKSLLPDTQDPHFCELLGVRHPDLAVTAPAHG